MNLRATGAERDGAGGRLKSQNRKNVYPSPYVKEPLNSKVIKFLAPELRRRKYFLCFEIPMFYFHGHSIYVSYIAISWLWDINTVFCLATVKIKNSSIFKKISLACKQRKMVPSIAMYH